MNPLRQTVTALTIADGTGTVFSQPIKGRIVAVHYTKVDFAAGVDFTITNETNGQGIWTESDVDASTSVYPTQLDDDQVGVVRATVSPIILVDERVKIVIASGGNVKTGTFVIVSE